jgi:predicted nucleic acid-binding protein
VNLLLDTNVLSEVRRPAPDLNVLSWLDAVDEDRVFISVASIAELRRTALAAWLADDLPACFAERILPIDRTVAEHWGVLMAQSRRSGVALSVLDGFFAATARAKDLTLVTRNVKDFASCGVPLFNPWNE